MDGSISVSIGELIVAFLVAMSIPSGITGFLFWNLERKITSRDKKKAAAEAEAREKEKKAAEEFRKQEAEREQTREEYEMSLVMGTWAALALGEATAKAVQRIPDAKCNGDMHAALEYAAKIKHQQKEFLAKQGIQALWE